MATLDGKVAIVAGGGTGIGRATAILFAGEGARVVVFGRRPEPLADVVDTIVKAGGQASAVSGDVASEADVERLVGRGGAGPRRRGHPGQLGGGAPALPARRDQRGRLRRRSCASTWSAPSC